MELGSGRQETEHSPDYNTFDINPTIFVPRTQGYKDTTTTDALSYNSTSENFLHIFTSRSQRIPSFTVNQTLENNVINIVNKLGSTTLPSSIEGNNVVLIVGITCGVIGLLIGVMATAGVWIYVHKKRRKAANRRRHTSAHQKNPKEMTFEPLDMSLTLPCYQQNQNTLDKRKSLSDILASNATLSRDQFSDVVGESNLSYQGFTPPLPPMTRSAKYAEDYLHPRESNDNLNEIKDNSLKDIEEINHVLSQKYGNCHGSNISDKLKRPVSISTRDSFSSGLGTGTESDVFPYDSKGSCIPGRSTVEAIILPYDIPVADKAVHIRNELSRRHGKKALCVVRECAGRRSKRSISGNQKKRSTRKSDTISSYTSSSTASGNECSSADISFSHSVLPSIIDVVSTSPSKEKGNMQSNSETAAWSSGQDTDDATEWEKLDSEEKQIENTAYDNDDVVSTYFDMHFPPTPILSNKIKRSVSESHTCASWTPTEVHARTVTLLRRNSDVTIDL